MAQKNASKALVPGHFGSCPTVEGKDRPDAFSVELNSTGQYYRLNISVLVGTPVTETFEDDKGNDVSYQNSGILLLEGAEPSELLAITFTRKAAQEMRERLLQLLEELALASDGHALALLVQRGLNAVDAERRLPVARGLYQRVLASPFGLSVDTFHSWFARLRCSLLWPRQAHPRSRRSALSLRGESQSQHLYLQWSFCHLMNMFGVGQKKVHSSFDRLRTNGF